MRGDTLDNAYFTLGTNTQVASNLDWDIYTRTGSRDLGFYGYGPSADVMVLTNTNGGRVGIGTTAPTAKLEVNGQVKITGGAPGAGKVLTSDAAGLATWQTPTGGGGGSIANGTVNGQTLYWNGTAWTANTNLFNNNTNVGIGTATPGAKLQVEGKTIINYNYASQFNMSNQNYIKSTGGSFAALSFIASTHTNGVIIEHDGGNALGVYDTAGINYSAINASAFNVGSDIRIKNSIDYIQPAQFDGYMDQIRNIQSATYFYNGENRPYKHVGFIAQSLPRELVNVRKEVKPGQPENMQLVNLADVAGLSLIGIKALDSKQTELETVVKQQQQLIEKLEQRIQQLENQNK